MSIIEDRLWAKVNKNGPTMPHMDSPCWEWTGGKNGRYGRFTFNYQSVPVHRLSMTLAGRDPTGLLVCHRCDNPICVNPDHLFLGTHTDNMADKVAKGRQAKGDNTAWRLYPERCPRGPRPPGSKSYGGKPGEANNGARLTEAQVIFLRADHARGDISTASLAKKYGIDKSTVLRIVRRQTWLHI